MRLRSHLMLLMIGTLLPMFVLAMLGALWLTERERNTFERGATERVRALATAVDNELRGSIDTAQALATSDRIAAGDFPAVHDLLVRAARTQPDWYGINLADASGQQLVNSLRPYGAQLPVTSERRSFEQARRSGQPAVGHLSRGLVTEQLEFSVRVPVAVGGSVKYVLSAVVKPQSVNALLAAQRLPRDWVGVVLDGNNRVVSRTVNPEGTLGKPAAESLQNALTRSSEGWFQGTTVEGFDVYSPYSRSSFSGWSVALGIPAEVVDAARYRTLSALVTGTAVAGLIAAIFAILLGRRFSGPIVELAGAARSMVRGEWPSVPVSSRVDEVHELGAVLKRSAEDLRQANEAQKTAMESLREADRAKDQFLAMLGHELRNPLGAIVGAISILRMPGASKEMSDHARAIMRRQVDNLTRLVDDLLDVSRVTTGKIALARQPIDLAAVTGSAVSAWRSSGRADRHEVITELAPAWVDADEVRIEQVVSNLLGNAIKYTPPGGCIRIGVEAAAGRARLVVSDTGAGIPREVIGRVFETFVQGRHTIDRAEGGLGVGLALVKAIVELHGGTVEARSDGPDRGSTFTVYLPLVARPERAGVTGRADTPKAASRRILIVEDNADGRDMLKGLLTLAGHEVHVSSDGLSAVAAAAKIPLDAALIDIGLPGIDGFEVARRIRAGGAGKSMQLIAISGYGQAEDRRRALEAGFDAHLTKPVSIERLTELLA